MMHYRSENRKRFAEVFTPPGTVFKMVLALREDFSNLETTYLDPCAGEGQFPCAVLVLKLFYNIDRLSEETALAILENIRGFDIQPVSIDKCRTHLLKTFRDAYFFFSGELLPISAIERARKIISQNFNSGDALDFFAEL